MKKLSIIIIVLLTYSCSGNKIVFHEPIATANSPQKIAVFIDGTANNEGSYTNISRLYNLTTLQSDTNVKAVYITGIGSKDGSLSRMIYGWGTQEDVVDAYLFLTDNYSKKRKDEIYLFGFSRGAYAIRILAGIIHVAGIPDLSHLNTKEKKHFVNQLYNIQKGKYSLQERRDRLIKKLGPKAVSNSVDIEFMGLWDTVEALGIPDFKEEYKTPNIKYVDQLCNVKKAAHALSLNDNRATVFTPILLSHQGLINNCKNVNISDVVNEVWFFGAHSDVGGGYMDTDMHGISLNWMINQLKPYDLVQNPTKVYAQINDISHDPKQGFAGLFYARRDRNLKLYASDSTYNNGKIKIHNSVFERLKYPLKNHDQNLLKQSNFKHCFEYSEENGYQYIESSNCFEIISEN